MGATTNAVNAFFRSRQDALTAANDAALKDIGRQAKNMANKQLRSRFSGRAGRAGTKFLKNPPATIYVNIRPSFLEVFETGTTIKGDRFLVIPIKPFKRVGKRGLNFKKLSQRFKLQTIPTKNGGYLVVLDGRPAYNLVRQSTLPQRTDIRENAAKIAEQHADIVEDLLNARL